jgi:hypothetical protein
VKSGELKRLHLGMVFAFAGIWNRIMVKVVGENDQGIATVRLADGAIYEAEIHGYEATCIGRKQFKIKRIIL